MLDEKFVRNAEVASDSYSLTNELRKCLEIRAECLWEFYSGVPGINHAPFLSARTNAQRFVGSTKITKSKSDNLYCFSHEQPDQDFSR